MAELIVVGFEGTRRAREVLDQVESLNALTAIDLRDAVAVYRTNDGKLRTDRSVEPTSKEGAALGGLVGAVIGGLLAAPFTAGASVPAAAVAVGAGSATLGAIGGAVVGFDDATSFKESYGISEELVRQVGGMVQPGQSAVFVLAHASDPAVIAEQFRGYGGTILRTSLSPALQKKVQETIALAQEPLAR